MESLPSCNDLQRRQCSDRGNDYLAEPKYKTNEGKATSNGQAPSRECNVNSTDREKLNTVCSKCLQATGNSALDSSVNEPVFDVYKPKNCRKIADYLEKGKDDNYFEEYLLPAKVLSKFALLLGKCVIHIFSFFLRLFSCYYIIAFVFSYFIQTLSMASPSVRVALQKRKCFRVLKVEMT